MKSRRAALVGPVVGALIMAACSRGPGGAVPQPSTSPASSAAPRPTPCALGGASQTVRSPSSAESGGLVTDVRYTSGTCPRIVFEFEDHVPGYAVTSARPPFEDCGSGRALDTSSWKAGAYFTVRLSPSGSTELGPSKPRQTYKGPRDIVVDGPVLKHLAVTCDFEAVFSWVVGLDAGHPFQVSTLENPPRLVIDVSGT